MLHEVAWSIWRGFPPILLVFGTIGNLMTVIVLMQRKNRNSSLAKYLSALAVADLIVLWMALPRNWLNNGFDVDLRPFSEFVCKVQLFLVYFGSQNSALLVVLVTVERFLCAWLPLKVKRICTARNANIVIISVATSLTLLNSHLLFGMGLTKGNICYPSNESYAYFLFNIWSLISLFGFSLTPLLVLVVLNTAIIVQILMVRRKSQTQVAPETVTPIAMARKIKNRQITAMLITLNIVFMVCVTPLLCFLIFYTDWVLSHETNHSDGVLELVWSIFNALFYTNNAVNFILYLLSRSAFRKEAKDVLFRSLNSCKAICKRKVHSRENNVTIRGAEENVELQNIGVFAI
ncbi:C-C chemokine receptor type 1-like [Mercenaria mercenaria]|uniref:C-C chemokine receptor type 1-like n=1 Tax=Mercenaria mercenaria TaxID=6596 RepID=UPI00234FA097|nr:C-C chemokine receptor type 1-like [Mercenaria mercenaria]